MGDMLAIKKVTGASLNASELIAGVAFKKTFSYAGFEQLPKAFDDAKVLLLNVELELKAEKDNAEIRIDDVSEYQRIVDAEYRIIGEKMDNIVATGANVILSKLPIGDLRRSFSPTRGSFAPGVSRVQTLRVLPARRARPSRRSTACLRMFLGCAGGLRSARWETSGTTTLLGAPRPRRRPSSSGVAPSSLSTRPSGRCTTPSWLSGVRSRPRPWLPVEAPSRWSSRGTSGSMPGIRGKAQILINAFAKALEIIPRQLASNAGFDATDILNKLRQRHAMPDGKWFGVDIMTGDICDTF